MIQEVQIHLRIYMEGLSHKTNEAMNKYLKPQINDEVTKFEVDIDYANSFLLKLTGGLDATHDVGLNEETKELILKEWTPDLQIPSSNIIIIKKLEEREIYGTIL